MKFFRQIAPIQGDGEKFWGNSFNTAPLQELKIAQLSNSQSEGVELDEYAAHLERAYRLCAACEDLVATKLRGQDAKLAPSVLEYRLERSRLERSGGGGVEAGSHRQQVFWSVCCKTLVWVQVVLAIVGLLMILDQTRILDKLASWHPALEGLYLVSDFLCALLPTSDLALSLCLLSVVALQLIQKSFARNTTLVAKNFSPSGASFKTRLSSTSFCHPDILDQEGTINEGLEELSSFEEKSPSPPPLFHPLSSTPTLSNPLKTRDEVTINHEFALVDSGGNNSGCDISVLSLGSPPSSPLSAATRGEAFPSVPRQYSPPPSSTLSLFSPKRPLLRPSRLTSSWVAGGYWTPPSQQPQSVTISRSSSQSSGFVSATPSVNNFSATPSINNFFPPPSQRGSVLNFPTSLALNRAESDRFSLASEPLAAHLSPPSPTSRHQFASARHHQQLVCVSLSMLNQFYSNRTVYHSPVTVRLATTYPQSRCKRWRQGRQLRRRWRGGPSPSPSPLPTSYLSSVLLSMSHLACSGLTSRKSSQCS